VDVAKSSAKIGYSNWPMGVAMYENKFRLSDSDITSGRFKEVADFVREHWPSKDIPSSDEALEIVAKSLGFENFSEASSSGTATPPERSDHMWLDIGSNFRRLGLFKNKDPEFEKLSEFERLTSMINMDHGPEGFVKKWPLHLLGRWNFDLKPCLFSEGLLKTFEQDFDILWGRTKREQSSFKTIIKNQITAASLIATIASDFTLDDLREKNVGEIIDDEMAESMFLDIMPLLFSEIFRVNDTDAGILEADTGFGMTDIWAQPQTEECFPNLFEHLRNHVFNDLLKKRAITLYVKEKYADGYYHSPDDVQDPQPSISAPLNDESFSFFVQRDEIESENFRTYTWRGQVKNLEGKILAEAKGTYISGSANRDVAGFDLISACDEMSDTDVEIVDIVLEHYKQSIQKNKRRDVDKGSINTRLIFEKANLVTIWKFERSAESYPGCGTHLLSLCLDELKRKFKRNIRIAALIEPYQYHRDSTIIKSVSEQRLKDIEKISKTLAALQTHPHVLGLFLKGNSPRDTDSTFVQYCGSAYLGI
jgi:hypothetical protein